VALPSNCMIPVLTKLPLRALPPPGAAAVIVPALVTV
jgi:hypothetical protein